MFDDDWETISGQAAGNIELFNLSNQINLIRAFIVFLKFHDRGKGTALAANPPDTVLMELHRAATLLLLHQPGKIREAEDDVVVQFQGKIVHRPPTGDRVQDWLERFFSELRERWSTDSAIRIAAFALWMISWIHPFKNGNGRTARAFAYLCLCLKLGFELPGRKIITDLIMNNKVEFEGGLRVADQTFAAVGVADISVLEAFLARLLALQLSSVDTDGSA
jgi:Fic family protein